MPSREPSSRNTTGKSSKKSARESAEDNYRECTTSRRSHSKKTGNLIQKAACPPYVRNDLSQPWCHLNVLDTQLVTASCILAVESQTSLTVRSIKQGTHALVDPADDWSKKLSHRHSTDVPEDIDNRGRSMACKLEIEGDLLLGVGNWCSDSEDKAAEATKQDQNSHDVL